MHTATFITQKIRQVYKTRSISTDEWMEAVARTIDNPIAREDCDASGWSRKSSGGFSTWCDHLVVKRAHQKGWCGEQGHRTGAEHIWQVASGLSRWGCERLGSRQAARSQEASRKPEYPRIAYSQIMMIRLTTI